MGRRNNPPPSPDGDDEPEECPLCMEVLEVDDINFYPCSCGYQICRFCWHRIRTDENGLCPACRQPYSETPAEFNPVSREELQKIKEAKRKKKAEKRQKVVEQRRNLANVRVVQKNLVYVVGLPPRLGDESTLRKPEYFGQYGKIQKIVVNRNHPYSTGASPSVSAYITFYRDDDASACVRSVDQSMVDYRTLKASLGTTKYCSSFLRNVPCPNPECMYLHELGDDKVSYTKEDMLAGKHQSDVTVSAEDEAAALAAANAAAAAVKSQPVVKAPTSREATPQPTAPAPTTANPPEVVSSVASAGENTGLPSTASWADEPAVAGMMPASQSQPGAIGQQPGIDPLALFQQQVYQQQAPGGQPGPTGLAQVTPPTDLFGQPARSAPVGSAPVGGQSLWGTSVPAMSSTPEDGGLGFDPWAEIERDFSSLHVSDATLHTPGFHPQATTQQQQTPISNSTLQQQHQLLLQQQQQIRQQQQQLLALQQQQQKEALAAHSWMDSIVSQAPVQQQHYTQQTAVQQPPLQSRFASYAAQAPATGAASGDWQSNFRDLFPGVNISFEQQSPHHPPIASPSHSQQPSAPWASQPPPTDSSSSWPNLVGPLLDDPAIVSAHPPPSTQSRFAEFTQQAQQQTPKSGPPGLGGRARAPPPGLGRPNGQKPPVLS